MWKKIVDSQELVSYEKKKKDLNIRIEARLDSKKWNIFKRYFNERGVNLIENYTTINRSEALHLVDELLEEKDLSVGRISEIINLKKNDVSIKLVRDFKDYETEKWIFYVNNEKVMNFAIISFTEDIKLDMVMHERYRHLAESIMESLIKSLGLKKFNCPIEESCYFFTKTYNATVDVGKKNMLISEIKMDLES